MKDQKRAIRRQHRERLKKNRKGYWFARQPYSQVEIETGILKDGSQYVRYKLVSLKGFKEKTPQRLSQLVTTPQACSCKCCGNSRKWFGRTLQEISFDELTRNEE